MVKGTGLLLSSELPGTAADVVAAVGQLGPKDLRARSFDGPDTNEVQRNQPLVPSERGSRLEPSESHRHQCQQRRQV